MRYIQADRVRTFAPGSPLVGRLFVSASSGNFRLVLRSTSFYRSPRVGLCLSLPWLCVCLVFFELVLTIYHRWPWL